MTTPYYEGDGVTLHHGDCLNVLPTLDLTAHVLLTDPPYFKVKDDEWDRQWKQADQFLAWLGEVMDAAIPHLAPSASAWVFAGPQMVSRVEREVVSPRMRVLNSVRWVKEQGWHRKADIPAQRRYLTPWEGIVFAERYDDAYGEQAMALHAQVFAPIGRYIQIERERAGLTRKQLAAGLTGYKNLESAVANVCNWELGKNLISAVDYESARRTLGGSDYLRREYDYLRREYEDLRREYEDLRRPFHLTRNGPVTDVWTFPTVQAYTGKHPCEKPSAMLAHMIETTSRRGDLILDPFAGSGSTADAARATGRCCVLIEKDERYCEQIAARLSQGDLFGVPA